MVHFFINRPVLSSVLSLLIVLSGLLALKELPVAQYPNILPPEVVVSASYPGASASIMANTVAAPLEEQINGVPHMLYMCSKCTNNGTMTLTVTFEIGTDPDQAAIDVNNRLQAASSRLPQEVRRQGVTAVKRSSSILQVITLYSDNAEHNSVYLNNYAQINVIDALKRLPGIGDASIFSKQTYAMRIWLQYDRLRHHNLTAEDVSNAIKEQNFPYAVANFNQEPAVVAPSYTYSATTQGQLLTPEEFGQIILRSDSNGSSIKLHDVARIELGAQDYTFEATYGHFPAAAIGIYLQPDANAVAAADSVHKAMKEMAQHFPCGMHYAVPFDTTLFVRKSIEEVIKTLGEALLLVMVIIYLFLQKVRATLIPLIAVPVSLIGTFGGMYLLGFSINLLTLFGFVLAIGIVVDDAIIVLENVERLMLQEQISAHRAAVKSLRQVIGPVIAIVLVLCAVFIPVGFMGGLTGEMYKQFAITIAISVVISGFVALTLTPVLCAHVLHHAEVKPPFFLVSFNRYFDTVTHYYLRGVRFMIARTKIGATAFLLVLLVCGVLYRSIPLSLVPEEDQGVVFVLSSLLPAASLNRTQAVTTKVVEHLSRQKEVEQIVTFSGFDLLSALPRSNAGVSFVMLKDWSKRTEIGSSAQDVAMKAMAYGSNITDGYIIAFCPPPIIGMNMTGGFEMYMQSRSGDSIEIIANMAQKYVESASLRKELKNVRSLLEINTPQYDVSVDRSKAKALGLSLDAIYSALQSSFGCSYINDFTLFGRTYRVNVQSDALFRLHKEDLQHIFARSSTGCLVSLDTVVTIKQKIGADIIERFNGFPSVKIIGEPAHGYSSGQALQAADEVAKDVLPAEYSIGWTGSSYQEKMASSSNGLTFIFGLLLVFLILAALYEKWSMPFVVLTSVPFAVLGALLAVSLRNLNNDVYLQVGLLTLIGLAAKNAILIVEFAIDKRKEGASIDEAIMQAAHLRFRPIIMTSMAFIFGCLPLIFSSGAGAASRQSIGTGVVGGMLGATFLAVFFIPLFFKLFMQMESVVTAALKKKYRTNTRQV